MRTFVLLCRATVAATALAALAAPAAADDERPRKLYAGAGLAVVDFDGDHGGIPYGGSSAGWQLYGGYQARELVALELAADRFTGVESGDVLGSGVERLRISGELRSVTVRGVFSLPLDDVLRRKITLFGTLGVTRSTEERSALELTTGRSTAVAERDNGVVLGVGATFDLPRVRLRVHLQSLDRDGRSLESGGVAAELRF